MIFIRNNSKKEKFELSFKDVALQFVNSDFCSEESLTRNAIIIILVQYISSKNGLNSTFNPKVNLNPIVTEINKLLNPLQKTAITNLVVGKKKNGLTLREKEIFPHLFGNSQTEVAEMFGISRETVNKHSKRIIRKLLRTPGEDKKKRHSITELMAYAFQYGYLPIKDDEV